MNSEPRMTGRRTVIDIPNPAPNGTTHRCDRITRDGVSAPFDLPLGRIGTMVSIGREATLVRIGDGGDDIHIIDTPAPEPARLLPDIRMPARNGAVPD